VFDVRREPLAERPGVLLAQVDLVRRAAEPELHRLVGRASVQIVFECDGHLRCHPRLHDSDGLSALYKIKCPCRDHGKRRPAAHLAKGIPDRPVRRGIDGNADRSGPTS
jgi:hypothetical protein